MFFIELFGSVQWYDSRKSCYRAFSQIRRNRNLRHLSMSVGFCNRFTGVGNWIFYI